MRSRSPSALPPVGTYSEGRLLLDIPAIPPSPNRYNGSHWSVYRNARKTWSWWIKYAVLAAKCGGLRWERSRVQVTRMSQRKLDPDNAAAACKVILDGLRDAHVIVNDTADNVEFPPVQQTIARTPRTLIEVIRCVTTER